MSYPNLGVLQHTTQLNQVICTAIQMASFIKRDISNLTTTSNQGKPAELRSRCKSRSPASCGPLPLSLKQYSPCRGYVIQCHRLMAAGTMKPSSQSGALSAMAAAGPSMQNPAINAKTSWTFLRHPARVLKAESCSCSSGLLCNVSNMSISTGGQLTS